MDSIYYWFLCDVEFNTSEEWNAHLNVRSQFLIFKPLSYCFEEAIGFDVKASFVGRPVSRLIR